jgi:hypothetical protein
MIETKALFLCFDNEQEFRRVISGLTGGNDVCGRYKEGVGVLVAWNFADFSATNLMALAGNSSFIL